MIHEFITILGDIAVRYGLAGLFLSSFFGSTIFVPFSVEAIIPILINVHANVFLVIITASVGALMGTWVNYWLGYYASDYIRRKMGDKNIEKAEKVVKKYGWPGLFLIIFMPLPLPIPVDPLTVIPGIARMDFLKFSLVVFLAKLAKYSFVVAVVTGIFNVLHI
jgi:membrane protein YqaA with SNARE-associated domain